MASTTTGGTLTCDNLSHIKQNKCKERGFSKRWWAEVLRCHALMDLPLLLFWRNGFFPNLSSSKSNGMQHDSPLPQATDPGVREVSWKGLKAPTMSPVNQVQMPRPPMPVSQKRVRPNAPKNNHLPGSCERVFRALAASSSHCALISSCCNHSSPSKETKTMRETSLWRSNRLRLDSRGASSEVA